MVSDCFGIKSNIEMLKCLSNTLQTCHQHICRVLAHYCFISKYEVKIWKTKMHSIWIISKIVSMSC